MSSAGDMDSIRALMERCKLEEEAAIKEDEDPIDVTEWDILLADIERDSGLQEIFLSLDPLNIRSVSKATSKLSVAKGKVPNEEESEKISRMVGIACQAIRASNTISRSDVEAKFERKMENQRLLEQGLEKHNSASGLSEYFANHIKTCHNEWVNNPTDFVAAYTALFQSSGVGKTHLLLKHLQNYFGLYLCFRPASDGDNFPPRSLVVDWLKVEPRSRQVRFAALMKACRDLFDEWKGSNEKNKPVDWYLFQLGNDRSNRFNAFAQLLISKAGKILSNEAPFKDTDDQKWNGQDKNNLPTISFSDLDFPFLVCIDESRELSETGLFSPVRRFFNSKFMKPGSNLFLMMTDTLAHLSKMTPQQHLDPSTRFYGKDLKILPIFNLVTTLDIFKEQIPRLSRGLDAWNTARFNLGRPLWSRYLKQTGLVDSIDFAKGKLTREAQNDSLADDNYLAKMACLGCRVVIRFFPGSQIASSLISGHMALCLHVFPKRGAMIASYASEPALAMASTDLLKKNQYKGWASSLDTLLHAINEGEVDTGKVGELVHRILLLLIMDLTVDRVEKLPTVYDFFVTMIGHEKVKKNFTENYIQKLKKCTMLFDHFIPATYEVKRERLCEFFNRGAAIACKPGHSGIDEELPFYMSEATEKDKQYGSVTFQTKNCISKHDSDYPRLASAKLKPEFAFSHPCRQNPDTPYVSIYHNLRSTESSIDQLPSGPQRPRGFKILGLGALDIFSDENAPVGSNLANIQETLKTMLAAQVDPRTLASEDEKEKVELMLPCVY